MDAAVSRFGFDYGELSEPEILHGERQAERLLEIGKKVAGYALETGAILRDMHDRLANHGNGTFDRWVSERCRWTPRHARSFMSAAARFEKVPENVFRKFDQSALLLLGAPSVSDHAFDEAVKIAKQGFDVPHKLAKEIVEKHSAKPAGLPAGYSPHGTGKKAGGRKSEAEASVALDGDTHSIQATVTQVAVPDRVLADPPPDPQPWPGGGEPDEQEAPEFAAPVVVETTAKTVAQPTDDVWLRDQLLPLFRAALKLSDSLVKPAVAKCLEDAVTMLSTGEPIEEAAPVKAATANEITAEPSVMSFDITPHKKGACAEWGLSQAYVDELQEVFAGVDVLAECRKARLWCANNPTKRKTAKGMREFLRRWIEKQQNSGGGRASSRPAGPTSVVDDYLREFGGQE